MFSTETWKLTDEESYLVGYVRNFCSLQGERMYIRAPASHGSHLRRIGATDHCIVCGILDLPGVLAFAHIHIHDLALSPDGDPSRVFSTVVLLQAEDVWIQNRRRPKPHPRDIAMMKRVKDGDAVRQCVWNEKRVNRRAVVNPESPPLSFQVPLF